MLFVYNLETKYFQFTVSSVDKFNQVNTDGSLGYTSVEFTESNPIKFQYYKFDETNNTWSFDEKEYIIDTKRNYLKMIKKVAGKLIENAPYIILPDISKEQVDAYRVKYEQAKANNTSFFEYEAKITGVSVEELIQIVLQKGAIYEGEYNDLVSRIEGMRRGTKLLALGEKFDCVERGLLFMKKLSKDLTYQMFLDYVAGLVSNMGDLAPLKSDGTLQVSSVIDIIGFIPSEDVTTVYSLQNNTTDTTSTSTTSTDTSGTTNADTSSTTDTADTNTSSTTNTSNTGTTDTSDTNTSSTDTSSTTDTSTTSTSSTSNTSSTTDTADTNTTSTSNTSATNADTFNTADTNTTSTSNTSASDAADITDASTLSN